MALLGLVVLLAATLFATTKATTGNASTLLAGNVFYVSKSGNNADGRSWGTAWNELSQINWTVVQPGDTILVDGGTSQMVYASTLTLAKSGTSAAPIQIRLASEAGRNGRAVIFGGRSTLLPYCNQSGYSYQTSGVRNTGISTGSAAWVVIDGTKWRGITIYGHNGAGIKLNNGSSNITIRNVEVYDNGTAMSSGGSWSPDQPGVALSGTNITMERALVHDNGQDAFQSGGGVSNFTLRDSWLYNERKAPSGAIWNECRHSDGIQIYAGFEQSGVTIEGSVIGPGFMQGVLLGQSPYNDSSGTRWAVVHNVTVRNSLWYGSTNCNICDYNNTPVKPRNWRIENVTSDRPTGDPWHNIQFFGDPSEITVTNSVFYGGYSATVPAGGAYSGNYQYELGGRTIGTIANPKYANGVHGTFSTSADFTLAADSPAKGKGSSITSGGQLLGQAGSPAPAPTASPSPSPTPTSTLTPSPSPTPTLTPSPTPAPTQSPSPSPTAEPTLTPSPSPDPTTTPAPEPTKPGNRNGQETPTPLPSPEPTATPSPTETPTPIATPTPTPTPSPVTETVTMQVGTSADDAVEQGDLRVHWGWGWTFPNSKLPYFAARFPQVSVPQGASVQSAKLLLWFTDGNGPMQARIYGDAADNSVPIVQTAGNLSSRPSTQNALLQDFGANPLPDSQFGAFDVTGIVRELTQRSGWAGGNAITLITRVLSGDSVSLHNWNVDPAHAPKLEITYSK